MHFRLVANQNQKTKIKTLYILKTLYNAIYKQYYCCFHGAPKIFKKKKKLLHIDFGSNVTKQSK